MDSYFESTVLRAGDEAQEMVDGGVLIFYADPLPDALESVSIVHSPTAPLSSEIRQGDTLILGEQRMEVVAVGERAAENLRSLGHVVVYRIASDAEETQLLPGAVHARGTLALPAAGDRIALISGGV